MGHHQPPHSIFVNCRIEQLRLRRASGFTTTVALLRSFQSTTRRTNLFNRFSERDERTIIALTMFLQFRFVRVGAPHFIARDRYGVVSPLTPALSPLRGEGVAVDVLAGSIGRAAFSSPSDSSAPSAASGVRFARVARPAPSPLKGERAGVRGEDDRKLPCNKFRSTPRLFRYGAGLAFGHDLVESVQVHQSHQ